MARLLSGFWYDHWVPDMKAKCYYGCLEQKSSTHCFGGAVQQHYDIGDFRFVKENSRHFEGRLEGQIDHRAGQQREGNEVQIWWWVAFLQWTSLYSWNVSLMERLAQRVPWFGLGRTYETTSNESFGGEEFLLGETMERRRIVCGNLSHLSIRQVVHQEESKLVKAASHSGETMDEHLHGIHNATTSRSRVQWSLHGGGPFL